MANGDGTAFFANGNAQKTLLNALIGTGVVGVLAAGMLAVANDARVAINVAAQHGEEILLLRGEIAALREEMRERTQSRFTSRDFEAHEKYIESRIEALEKQIQALGSN